MAKQSKDIDEAKVVEMGVDEKIASLSNKEKAEYLSKALDDNQRLREYIEKLQAEAEKKINELNVSNIVARLSFLFDVLKQSTFFDEDFIKDVVAEIKQIIILPKDEQRGDVNAAG